MNDFKMTRQVRVMFTRMRIDSSVVTIHCNQGILTLGGVLQYPYSTEGVRKELNFELLHEMDRQFRRLEGIHQIIYQFENWSHNCDGHWSKKEMKKKARVSPVRPVPRPAAPAPGAVV